MMKAVWYRRQGPAREVLETGELPVPEPGPGEVRVRLRASAVNPADAKRRAGGAYGMDHPRIVPNSDGAGEVDAVGEGADPRLLGRRVWLYNGQRNGRWHGTASEWISLDADLVSPLPDHVGDAEGACLGIPCMTAWCCVHADGPVAGAAVLITGGGGAVGNYAVQHARRSGARVLATVRGEAGEADAARAGAHEIIRRNREDVAERVLELTDGAGVERIVEVDLGGNLADSVRALAVNGTVAAYASDGAPRPELPFHALMRRSATLRTVMLPILPAGLRRRAQADIRAWLERDGGFHRVAGSFPLSETAAAHEAVEAGGKRGTVVVRPDA